ncbi:hypothetical protein FA95DRAFT_1563311 [Auriscalpium vulgare]|uniref:Uncharacterized protein n=1 Tax=Auriscalpium vulgare TaxID=40419 RepID=A0ACB8RH79_9AGAM|nr:hypothetical protein FA95DRAFT_1563311 [Auriscalpium vulgare]
MGASLYQELYWASARAFRTLVPPLEERIPVTWTTAPYTLLHFIPFTFMSYLVRRPDTQVMRLLMLPTLITTAVRSAFGYVWLDPRYNVYNWGLALFSFFMMGKGIDIAFARNGRHKQGENKLGSMHEPAIAAKPGSDAPGGAATLRRPGAVLPDWLEDSFELMFAMRGLGWVFGEGVYTPVATRPQARGPFLRATALSFLGNFLLVDLIDGTLKLFPGVGDPLGGSIFYPGLPWYSRYVVSTAIHGLTGTALLGGFGMVYDLLTLIAVGALGHAPSAWPPVMDNPWAAESLHDFWAKRWHQLLRQTFLVYGGIPGRKLAGNVGLVLGTFFASGLYHECTMYAMGRGWDSRVPVFFLLQGGAVIGERVWRRVTGRRVGGFLGRLWVYFDLFVLAQPLVDAWHVRGLAGGMVIPPPISPARLWLFPAIRSLLAH